MKNFKLLSFLFSFTALFLGQVMAFESGSVFAREYIDYETFIHLDNQSQKKVVLMVMDYIVASESIYPDKEPYLNTTNRKTVKALQTLWNQIIISSAYAQKEQFETNQLCLYGGWLSVIVSQNGKEVCTHPMNIQKNLKSIKDAGAKKRLEQSFDNYNESYNDNKSCQANSAIICSPEYFGKDPNNNKPFCAPGSSDSKNTSLKCMSLVYNHEKKDEILQNIIDNVLRNEDSARAFSDTLQMMYGVCVCGDDSYINQSYSTRIFNHRTCYGIIMQTNEILEHMFNTDNKERSCSLLGAIPHQKDIANMSDFALEAYNKISKFFINSEDKNKDDIYTAIFAENNDQEDMKLMQKRRDQLEIDKAAGTCPLFNYKVILSKKDNGDNTYQVTAELKGINAKSKIGQLVWNWPEGVEPKKIDDFNYTIKQTKEEMPISATLSVFPSNEITIPALSEEKSLTIASIERNEQEKIESLKANLVGVDPIDANKFKWELVVEGAGEITGDKDTAQAKIPEKEAYKVLVTYDDLVSEEYEVKPIAVACTITQNTSTSTQEKGADFTLKLGEMVFKDKKITWSPEPSKTSENMLEAHYDEYKDQTITVTIDGKTCSFVPKEDQGKSNEDSGYGITISQTSSNSTQSDFKAVIKKDDKELEGIPEGYDVIWYTYDAGTAPKKEEKPASSYDEFDSPSSSEGTGVSQVDTGDTTSITKSDKEQKVYAQLVKGDEKIKSNELTVDKKSMAQPANKNLNNGPMQFRRPITPNPFRKGLSGERGIY